MNYKKQTDCIFHLLQPALCNSIPNYSFENIDWQSVFKLAMQHGVAALCLDGIQKMENLSASYSISMPKQCKLQWIGTAMQQERQFAKQMQVLKQLSCFYNKNNIKMMLLKGYGCSLNYPIPNHRPCGDVDVYLYGKGGFADTLINKEFGIQSKQNEDKHSTFVFNSILVENHALIINTAIHPQLCELEDYFEKEAENAIEMEMGEGSFYIPSINMNALFLAYHTASHFCKDEANIRQLCDWATFIQKNGKKIDWDFVEKLAKQSGFFKFFCCLNGIIQDYLGVASEMLPDWERNKDLEQNVVKSIVFPEFVGHLSVSAKMKRFFANKWKYNMVYNENLCKHFVLLAQSYYRTKIDKKAKSIWAKKNYDIEDVMKKH